MTRVALILLAFALVYCGGPDETKGRRFVELETEQAQIVEQSLSQTGSAGCIDMSQRLDAWYAENQAEVDSLYAWFAALSDSDQSSVRGAYPNGGSNIGKQMQGTIRCGFVAWNTRRRPG
ncbi:MAG: hypothetical protein AAGE52_39010 [Myxococcota bacterium]